MYTAQNRRSAKMEVDPPSTDGANVPAGMNCARLTATFASHVYDKGAIDTIVAFFTN